MQPLPRADGAESVHLTPNLRLSEEAFPSASAVAPEDIEDDRGRRGRRGEDADEIAEARNEVELEACSRDSARRPSRSRVPRTLPGRAEAEAEPRPSGALRTTTPSSRGDRQRCAGRSRSRSPVASAPASRRRWSHFAGTARPPSRATRSSTTCWRPTTTSAMRWSSDWAPRSSGGRTARPPCDRTHRLPRPCCARVPRGAAPSPRLQGIPAVA